jgi:hypothetical protein
MIILQREVIITLAIGGAILAIIGNVLDLKGILIKRKSAQIIRKTGYAVSWMSVACFIAVGFFQ